MDRWLPRIIIAWGVLAAAQPIDIIDLHLLTAGVIKVSMDSGFRSVTVPVGYELDVYLETVLETGVADFDSTWFLDLDEQSTVQVGPTRKLGFHNCF